MSWTDYRCEKCMKQRSGIRRVGGKERVVISDYFTIPQESSYIRLPEVCDGSCRKILPPRRVSTPKNLDPDAYDIRESGYDHGKWMIDGKIDLLGK